jgi:Ca2+-binding RTX toxin-like protein
MTVYTGTNNSDTIIGGSGSDTIYGLGGNDLLEGQDGSDTIYGGDGNDSLFGHGGLTDSYSDYLYGENGDDSLFISTNDTANGGAGFDKLYVYYMNTTSGISMNFSSLWTGGSISNGFGTLSNIESIEVVYGGSGNDTLTIGGVTGATPELYGMAGADTLTGGAGDDWIESYNGMTDTGTEADTLYGLGGNDLLSGGIGDYLDGGSGTDALALDLSIASTGVSLDFAPLLAGATATIFGGTLISFEHVAKVVGTAFDDTIDTSADNYSTKLYGGAGADTLIGNAGNNVLEGGSGIDSMTGGAGDDIYYVDNASDLVIEGASAGNDIVYASIGFTLPSDVESLTLSGSTAINGAGSGLANTVTGNTGANTLDGLAGDDILSGQAGIDILIGGSGRDVMTGGADADTFRFATGDMAGVTASTADLITDFSHAQADKIDLSGLDAIAGGSDDAFAFLGTGAFTGVAGQLRYDYAAGYTTVYGDTNGDGVADIAVALTGNITLVSGDFVL